MTPGKVPYLLKTGPPRQPDGTAVLSSDAETAFSLPAQDAGTRRGS
jgi:hypothetical protein